MSKFKLKIIDPLELTTNSENNESLINEIRGLIKDLSDSQVTGAYISIYVKSYFRNKVKSLMHRMGYNDYSNPERLSILTGASMGACLRALGAAGEFDKPLNKKNPVSYVEEEDIEFNEDGELYNSEEASFLRSINNIRKLESDTVKKEQKNSETETENYFVKIDDYEYSLPKIEQYPKIASSKDPMQRSGGEIYNGFYEQFEKRMMKELDEALKKSQDKMIWGTAGPLDAVGEPGIIEQGPVQESE